MDIFADRKFLDSVHSNNLTSVEGKLADIKVDSQGKSIYVNFDGATSLNYKGRALPGQGVAQHAHGFSSPIGRLKKYPNKSLEDLTTTELNNLGIKNGKKTTLEYSSGISVEGTVTGITRKGNKNVILTFEQATVKDANGLILFDPTWGTYDMLVIDNLILGNHHKRSLLRKKNDFSLSKLDLEESVNLKLIASETSLVIDYFDSIFKNKVKLKMSNDQINLDLKKLKIESLTDDEVQFLYSFQKTLDSLAANPQKHNEIINQFTGNFRYSRLTLPESKRLFIPDSYQDFLKINNYKKADGSPGKGWKKIELKESLFVRPGGDRVSYRGPNGLLVLESIDVNKRLKNIEVMVLRDTKKPEKGVAFFAYETKGSKRVTGNLSDDSRVFFNGKEVKSKVNSTKGCISCHRSGAASFRKSIPAVMPTLTKSSIHPNIVSDPHPSSTYLEELLP
jgi:hypothetical protein